jgi:hypothetical protein
VTVVTNGPETGDTAAAWLDALEATAPNAVAAYRGIEAGRFISVRREVRRRAGAGSAATTVAELETLAEALATIVARLPDAALRAPGGESDWNVAQTIGHDAAARSGLVLAASLAAAGRWPADAPTVIPGVPGPAGSSRAAASPPGRAAPSRATRPTPARSTTRRSAGCAAASGCCSPRSTT